MLPLNPAEDADEGADPETVEVSPADLKLAHQQAAAQRAAREQQQQQQQHAYPAHLHRPPDPTIPLTPAIEWEPIGPPTPPQVSASAGGGYESTLREQIMSGISVPPSSRPAGHPSPRGPMSIPFPAPPMSQPQQQQQQQQQHYAPPPPSMTPRGSQARLSTAGQQAAAPTHTSGHLSEAWASAPSGSYSASGQREIASRPGGSSASASRPRASAQSSMPIGYVVASAFFLAIAVVGFGLYLAFEVISL